jgi:hypothetical protein
MPSQLINLILIFLITRAKEKKDFHHLSQGFKILMIAGILSMVAVPLSYS